ncbi:MAG: hypothetical protein KGL39_37300 [Patescibacteria group bacterium]|nr:hypothetical protein [Patescibacteria group bacterium]
MSLQFGYGLRRLVDAQQNFVRAGHPVYLRLRNFPVVQTQQWAELGFSITPSGSPTGTSDILIAPPPGVIMMSLHNIGMSAGKFRFGARQFMVSHSFVQAQMTTQGISDPLQANQIWEGSNVVGLVMEELLFSIEDVRHQEVAGETVWWLLRCNANTIK